MARYRKVEVITWNDDKFCALSGAKPNGQTLWFYLLTGPRTTSFPGLLVARAEVMASDLRWSLEGFREAFGEASTQGLVKADWKAGLVVLRKALLDSTGEPRDSAKPESPNVIKSWAKSWDEVPDCQLKYEYLQSLESFTKALGEAYQQAFREGFRKALLKASTHPSPNQDQDQDQEQKQEQEQEVVPQDKPAEKRRRHSLPALWTPSRSESVLESETAAKARGIDLEFELKKLTDWAAANNAKKADWDATWRNWLRNAKPATGQQFKSRSQNQFDLQMERVRMLEAQEATEPGETP